MTDELMNVSSLQGKVLPICFLLVLLFSCMAQPASAELASAKPAVKRSQRQSWDVRQSLALARRQEHQKNTIRRLLAHGKPAAASRYLQSLPTTPCCVTEIDWLIRELSKLNQFDEALTLLDNYEVGSNNGKPFSSSYFPDDCLFGSSPSYIYALRAKVLMDSGDRTSATKYALRSWYCAEVCKWKNKDVTEIMQALNVAAPPLVPIVAGNDKAFEVIDDLFSRTSPVTKRELEAIFGRQFKLDQEIEHLPKSRKNTHVYHSKFETDLFPVVRACVGDSPRLTVLMHVEQTYITRADLEKHFGPGKYHKGVRRGCSDEPDTIAFLRDGRLLTFELYPDQTVPTHSFDLMWLNDASEPVASSY